MLNRLHYFIHNIDFTESLWVAFPPQRVAAVGAAHAPEVLQLFARDAAASAASAAISAAASSFAAASASAAHRGPEQAQMAVHQGGFIVPGPAKIGAAAAAAMFDDNAANGNEDEEDTGAADDDDDGDDDDRMTDLAAPTLVLNRLVAYASPAPSSSVHASGGGSGKAAKRARHADS